MRGLLHVLASSKYDLLHNSRKNCRFCAKNAHYRARTCARTKSLYIEWFGRSKLMKNHQKTVTAKKKNLRLNKKPSKCHKMLLFPVLCSFQGPAAHDPAIFQKFWPQIRIPWVKKLNICYMVSIQSTSTMFCLVLTRGVWLKTIHWFPFFHFLKSHVFIQFGPTSLMLWRTLSFFK